MALTETRAETRSEDVFSRIKETARILLVDDEATVLRNLERLLRLHGYDCKSARSAAEARATLDIDDGYSLILTDVNMPGESGIELLEQVAKAHPDIATVMVTGIDDRNLAERALAMGAYGYVIKPFEPNEILIGISNALRRRTLELENRKHRTQLEQMVDERTTDLWDAIRQLETAGKELRLSREETIQRLAVAAEFRDDETGKHIERMSRYCALLARKIGGDYEGCELIRVATVMHDVGKIGIPDSILLKPGPLSSAEFEVMKTHAEIGKMILEGSEAELLQMATAIAATHHEWWDGSGYPSGLNAEEIPLEGRIAAIGDVFDALTSNRVYRKAFTLGEAVEIMKKERGTHFEPFLLDLFFDSIQELVDIKAAH